MEDYKIIFTDIDGTLLNDESQVPKQTALFLNQLNEKKHIPIVLVSARMPAGMRGIRETLGVNCPMVCYSGGYILDEKEQCLFSQTIEGTVVDQLIKEIKKQPEISINIYSHDRWYVFERENPWVAQEEDITGLVASVLPNEQEICRDVHKILCMGEPEQIKELEEKLKTVSGAAACRSKPTYLEIMPEQVSKGKALSVLGEYYKIGKENMIAFGDGHNDIDMIRYVGEGVAMGNGVPALKEAAKAVTLSNEEEGIRIYLEKRK